MMKKGVDCVVSYVVGLVKLLCKRWGMGEAT